MSMLEWAKREVEIASKRERGDKPADEWDYGCACYNSALKAFESLCGDGHSDMSIQFTKRILNRLIEGKPLTPIEDTEDVWSSRLDVGEGYISYQCLRKSSLFKTVYKDGTVIYTDNDRFVGVDPKGGCWHSGLVTAIGIEMYPIKMPYMPPDKSFMVYVEDCLTDPKNGDFDTEAVLYLITPDGEKVDINRYFREPYKGETPTYKGWVEITLEEYLQRKELDRKRSETVNK